MDQLSPCPYCGSKNVEFETVTELLSGGRDVFYPAWAAWCKGCSRLGPSGSKSEAAWEWNNIKATVAHEIKLR